MLTAFCLIVSFIFFGLLLGLIEVACAKNAEKKVRLIGKRRFGKMVHEEAKKKNKKYLKLTAGNFFAGIFFVLVQIPEKFSILSCRKKTKSIRKEIRKKIRKKKLE